MLASHYHYLRNCAASWHDFSWSDLERIDVARSVQDTNAKVAENSTIFLLRIIKLLALTSLVYFLPSDYFRLIYNSFLATFCYLDEL